MSQYGRPIQDITTSGWAASSGSTLYGCVDETPFSDTDYIRGTGTVTCELKLSSVTDPSSSSDHVVNWRAKSNGTGAGEKWSCYLYQGATLIATMINNATFSRAASNYTYTLTGEQADAISDYSDLRIRITIGTAGAAETSDVYGEEMVFPDVAAPVLTVQSPNHDQSAGSVSLTQHNILSSDDSSHSQSVDNIFLTPHEPAGSFTLTMQSSSHVQSADSLSLVQNFTMTVDDSTHLQAADNTELTYHVAGASLTVSNASHTQAVDSVSLTQHHILSVDNASHVQTADNIICTYHAPDSGLVVDNASHSQSVDSISLTQHNILSLDSSTHSQTAGNVSLSIPTTHWVLVVQDGEHLQYVDVVEWAVIPPSVSSGTVTYPVIEITRPSIEETRGVIVSTQPTIVITESTVSIERP